MEASPSGTGYRFVAADGGVFAYGAAFYGTPVFASTPTPAPAPGSTPTGIEASFSCTGSAGSGASFFTAYWTKANPGLVDTTGAQVALPWSGAALSPTDGYVVLSGLFYPNNPSSFVPGPVTCSTTVTWPGGSVTSTGSSASGNPFYAQVCSDYPRDSGWVVCAPGSDN